MGESTRRIRIQRDLAGIEETSGTVVVIDVFRASNTIIALLEAGAREVFLLADLEHARDLKRSHPERPLLGERGGVAPPDFDGGNSPASAHRVAGPESSPILTTSAGTQAIARLTSAERVLFASFANATAVAETLDRLDTAEVTLLPMGLEARTPAVEDEEAAVWIEGLLTGRSGDYRLVRKRLLGSSSADRLRRLGQDDDLEWCTELDGRVLVPVVVPGDPPRAIRLES